MGSSNCGGGGLRHGACDRVQRWFRASGRMHGKGNCCGAGYLRGGRSWNRHNHTAVQQLSSYRHRHRPPGLVPPTTTAATNSNSNVRL